MGRTWTECPQSIARSFLKIRALIDGTRNDSKSDVLREILLFDQRVDSIDKSRLLERILHRQNEDIVQKLAKKVLDQSSDEVVLSAARNLSTVTDEPSL